MVLVTYEEFREYMLQHRKRTLETYTRDCEI